MKKFFFMILLCVATSAPAAFVKLETAAEFKDLIQNSQVPVIVQFEAYWCGPCQNLIATFNNVAPSYDDNQVRLAYVDAYVNKSLQTYLQGGYPTVRTFSKGTLTSPSFVGSQAESELRSFIDGVISGTEMRNGDKFDAAPFCAAE